MDNRLMDIIRKAAGTGYPLAAVADHTWAAIDAAIRADERKRCAMVCDAEFWKATKSNGGSAAISAGNCAEAIRALED